jgi:hypothetical protein
LICGRPGPLAEQAPAKGTGTGETKKKRGLFPGLERLVFGKHRRDGLRGYGAAYQRRKFSHVVDMCNLETDNQAKTEAGDYDQGITQ